jgi:2-isopropylmalate synthase
MGLEVRSDYFSMQTNIDTTKINSISRLVSRVADVKIAPNKLIVGGNAFAHEAGIHRHGVLAKRETYEIMTPESIGIPEEKLDSHRRTVLGKYSGCYAFEKLVFMGDGPVDSIFKAINQIVGNELELELYEIEAATGGSSSQGEATVKISMNERRWNECRISTYIIESSIRAYLSAINAME